MYACNHHDHHKNRVIMVITDMSNQNKKPVHVFMGHSDCESFGKCSFGKKLFGKNWTAFVYWLRS